MATDSTPSRPIDLQPLINPKETIYFGICVVISLVVYLVLRGLVLSGGSPTQ